MVDKNSGVWSRVINDDDFKNLNADKVWHLLSLCVAETLGLAVVLGLVCGATVTCLPGTENSVTHLNVVLTLAFAISLIVMVFGQVSGCHVNPAVSLAALLCGHLSLQKFLMYVVSQCIGGCLGIIAVKVVSPTPCTSGDFCTTLPHPDVGPGRALLAETMLTAVLVLVVNETWERRSQGLMDSLPLKFGVAVAALSLPWGKFSGASMNPARSFGPALLTGNWTYQWVYWVGPMCGSVIATAIYRLFLAERTKFQPVNTTPDHIEELNHLETKQ